MFPRKNDTTRGGVICQINHPQLKKRESPGGASQAQMSFASLRRNVLQFCPLGCVVRTFLPRKVEEKRQKHETKFKCKTLHGGIFGT